MELSRLVLVVAGVGALVVALAISVPDGPLTQLVTAVGSDYLLVAAIAAIGLVVAAGRFHRGRTSTIEQATMPEPERPVSVQPLGADFDRALADKRLFLPVVGDERRKRLHAELRETAARTVCRVGHCGPETAIEHLARCDWTDDAEAAAFLRGETPPDPPLSVEVTGILRGEPWFRTQAANAADAIVAVAAEAKTAGGSGWSKQPIARGDD